MTLNRYATAKDGNAIDILTALKKVGATIFVLDTPCDVIVGWRKKNILLEIKATRKANLTPAQEKFHESWRGQIAIVYTVNEALEAVIGPSQIQGRDCHEQSF